jgi:hypothetical protein
MHIFTGAPANDHDVPPPADLRAEVDELLTEVAERLDELDEATLLALWRVLSGLLYGPQAGDGGGLDAPKC